MTIFSLRRHGKGLGLSPRRRAAPDGGAGPPGDTEAPSVPANLVATAVSSSQIDLTWDASTDNVAVTGYNIYRDNVLVDTSPTNSYSDTGLDPGTEYEYEVSAFDAASNESARSAPDSATTHQVIVTDGLVAEWRFDEGAGQVLTDYTGNGHHGRLGSTTGADAADPSWTTQGLSFDGGDFVEHDNAGISGTVPRTLIAVMKRVGANEFSCEWAGSGGAGTRMTLKLSAATNVMRMEYNSGGADLPTLPVAEDTWHFCGYTQSGNNANTGIGYLNGGAEALTLNRSTNTAGNFFWGRSAGTGRIMEAAYGLVYNRVLSPAEVEQNRQALKAVLTPRGIALP